MKGQLAGCSVLIVEDDRVFGQALTRRLRLAGVSTHWARSLAEGEALLRRHRPTLVLCDIRLPDGDGERLIARLMPELGSVPVIAMTAFGSLEQAVRLMRAGADDYFAKPFATARLLEKLAVLARRGALGAEDEAAALLDAAGWRSPPMQELQAALERVSASDAPVLLTGESGAGKGVAARRLHAMSGRRAPFVVVDCATLPADAAEADAALFGRGDAPGLVEAAGAGTLFLDQVAELAPPLQVRLLGLLEQRRLRRGRSSDGIETRARVLAATNADMPARVASGEFRGDLWFRLSVVVLGLPPLRTRPADVEDLARLFLRCFSGGRATLTDAAVAALLSHPWPGNVRELRNRVERAVLLSPGPALSAADLFPEWAPGHSDERAAVAAAPAPAQNPGEIARAAEQLSLAQVRDLAEREHIRRVLARCGGRVGGAAAALGVSRTTLWERMRRLGVAGQ